MVRRVLLVTLLLAACREKAVKPDDGELSVSPATIDFGTVWAGFPVSRTASVAFSGRSSCEVTLSASAPFSVTPSVHLEKAASVNVTVSASPSGAGSLSGTFTATGCGHTASATLALNALAVPDCGPGGPCTTVRFEPDSGFCTTDRKPDGLACADPCLTQPHCSAGECVGTPVACDDGDSCTLDGCGADGSCTHVPAQSFCPPLPGCTSACDGGSCGPLTEVWSYRAPTNPMTTLVADERGNIYWLEGPSAIFTGQLASLSRSGQLRYRVNVFVVSGETWPMYSDGTFVYLQKYGSLAIGLRGSDGAFLWYDRLNEEVADAGHSEVASMLFQLGRATAGSGAAQFPVGFSDSSGAREGFAVSVDLATGASTAVRGLNDAPFLFESDERGALYESVQSSNGYYLDAYDPAFNFELQSLHFLGPVAAGRIFAPDALLDADGGAVITTFTGNEIAPDVATSAVAVRRDTSFGKLVFFDPSTGVERGRYPLPDLADWDLYAVENGEVVAINRGGTNRLDGFDLDGGHLYRCDLPLPPGLNFHDSTLLIDGLLLVWTWDPVSHDEVLHAYALPGRREAAHGWVTRYGSAARTNRPK